MNPITPRNDNAAEMYVLGAILESGGRALDDITNLTAEDFYRPVHESLFALLRGMHGAGEPTEAINVFQRITTSPIRGLEPVYLQDLMQACTTWKNVEWYARTVRQLARLRRLRAAGERLIQLSGDTDIDKVDETVEAARAEVDIAGRDEATGELASIGDLMLAAMDRWESQESGVLPTGLYDLDRALAGGLRPGHLFIIGARPAVGKSVVASVVAHAMAKRGVGVLFTSLEMSRHEVTDRIAADVASVDLTHLTERNLTETDWHRVSAAYKAVADWPLKVQDRSNLTVAQIRARARDVARSSAGLGIVVVDYLQLVTPADGRAPRQEQVASVSRSLKLLAKELQVPVVALAQVNRGSTQRTDKRPVMSDLRESGGIEADADEIILLHRDDKDLPGEIEFIIEKNRHGRTGKVAMAWSPHYSRVSSMAREGA
jgi:replicative DNA helicase